LLNVAHQLKNKVIEGLRSDDQEIKCLPCYVPVTESPKEGRALVLDLGGSNVRTAVLSLQKGTVIIEKGPLKANIPLKRGVVLERKKYLNIQSELITSLDPPDGLPLGYCFSYPTIPLPNGDATLINWTKEVFVPDTEGYPVGRILFDHLKNQGLRCSQVTVINDTVASLLSGLALPKSDGYIGLIVGTGTNMATFINSHNIPKLTKELDWRGPIPVNLESGNFDPPHPTPWDKKVDDESASAGKQRFEKAVSGVYLGRLFKAVFPESNFDPKYGAEGLVHMVNKSQGKGEDNDHDLVALQIYNRSAKLVAASLAGLIKLLNESMTTKTVNIVAEGSLFWGKLRGDQHYLNMTKSTLKSLLTDLDLPDVEVEFVKIENANLIGSAIAALV